MLSHDLGGVMDGGVEPAWLLGSTCPIIWLIRTWLDPDPSEFSVTRAKTRVAQARLRLPVEKISFKLLESLYEISNGFGLGITHT